MRAKFQKASNFGIIVAALAICGTAFAGDNFSDVLPLPNEALTGPDGQPQPIQLPACPGVSIVEWRADSHVPWTDPAFPGVREAGVRVMNRLCGLALQRFPEFARSKGLKLQQQRFTASISLIPANPNFDGGLDRNLNGWDHPNRTGDGRFYFVTPYHDPSCVRQYGVSAVLQCSRDSLWGVYDFSHSFIFHRNDPVDRNLHSTRFFERSFLHELAHLLSDKWGLIGVAWPRSSDRDEWMADEWTRYLGYSGWQGDDGDSVYEDCQAKGGKDCKIYR